VPLRLKCSEIHGLQKPSAMDYLRQKKQ